MRPRMHSIPLTRVAVLRGVVAFLGRIGTPVDRLLEQVGLRPEVFDEEEGLIPLRLGMRFMELAARTEGIEHLGFRAGLATAIETLGTFGRVLRCSRSLAGALEAASSLGPKFNSGERFWLEVEGPRVHFCHLYLSPEGEFRQAEEYALSLALNVVRLAAGPDWVPADLRLQSTMPRPPRTLLTSVRMLPGEPLAGFTFPRALLDRRLPDPHGVPAVREEDMLRWDRSAPASDLPGSVHQVIDALSGDLRPKIGTIAGAIGISVRSLQRRLASAGVSYDRLVDDGNLAGAAELLRGPDKIIDVAMAMGYSDPAHFSRAFRRWTGLCPREFRRQAL